jgi:hypothetical protein
MSGALACYGRTASLAEEDPTDADKWYATRFWALQAMAAAAEAHEPPSHVERDLQGSRLGAAQATDREHIRTLAESCDRAMHSVVKR